jgi:hypothetical protein
MRMTDRFTSVQLLGYSVAMNWVHGIKERPALEMPTTPRKEPYRADVGVGSDTVLFGRALRKSWSKKYST